MKSLPSRVLAAARVLFLREPAAVISAVTAVVVFACAKAGVVVDQQSVAHAVALAVPFLLSGAGIRALVTPPGLTQGVKHPELYKDHHAKAKP